MEHRNVLVDTSVFIEYFRKRDKTKTELYHLRKAGYTLVTSSVCFFEYMAGSNHPEFDAKLFEYIDVIALDKDQAYLASRIFKELKQKNMLIEFRDILIAASAIYYDIPLATQNKKHFDRIEGLRCI